jgi:NitT/TauT family transport system permease protein
VALFGSIITLYTGFLETDPEIQKLVLTFGGNKYDILTKIILPASVPLFLSIMKVNIGLCLVGVIIGEFLAANAGLGYLIVYGSQVLKLDDIQIQCDILHKTNQGCGCPHPFILLSLYSILSNISIAKMY